MNLHDQRLSVLQKMERGELSMEEAARLLSRLDAGEFVELPGDAAPEQTETIEPVMEQPAASQPEPAHRRSELWLLPFVIGLLLTLSAASWMLQGYTAAGLGWGFWLSFIPLMLGVLIMWLAWEVRKARWLHLRIRQRAGRGPRLLVFSFPLPTRVVRWGMQRFGHFESLQKAAGMADFMNDLDAAVAKDGPVHILVDEGKEGDHVEIWID